ncbi:MAG: SigB/SigF/SigG family RNA polymerase sigma factor [Marmoricola sp.]
MTEVSERWSQEQVDQVVLLFEQLSQAPEGSEERRVLRDRIVEVHLPLLRYLARRFSGRTESFEDLVQVGSIGLLKAIDRFDPTLGHQFASYASPTIVGEIKRHLRDTGWLLRVPRRAQELHATVARVREEFSQDTGRYPTVSEIAERIDATPEEIAETLDVARSKTASSLEGATESDDHPIRQDLIAAEERGFDQVEDRVLLAKALAALTDQEREVVRLRFSDGQTQSQIAAVVGVSQMQVSRIITRSVAKMQQILDTPTEPV